MPMFEYKCLKCNNIQDAFRSVDARDLAPPTCKECGSAMKRIMHPQDTPKDPNARRDVRDPFRKI
jgi:putative FmdB family regulatory protein